MGMLEIFEASAGAHERLWFHTPKQLALSSLHLAMQLPPSDRVRHFAQA
jgi:hypothetical protein